MTYWEFEQIAKEIFGERWRPLVMAACDVTERTLDRWKRIGRVPVLAGNWIAEKRIAGV